MKKILFSILVIYSAHLSAQNKTAEKFAATITPEDLKAKLSVIASADMEGRETATQGQRKAATYIENYFKQLKLLPGDSGKYQMSFPVLQDSIESVSLKVNNETFVAGNDFTPNNNFPNGSFAITDIAFAGSGIKDSTQTNTDSVDVKDKWVLIVPPTDRASMRSLNRKIMLMPQTGAKGLLIVSNNFPSKTYSAKGRMYLPSNDNNSFPVVFISKKIASSILQTDTASINASLQPKLYSSNIQISLQKTTNHLQSTDVIGVLPGTDKKSEYVFVTGHYDHLGKQGDVIYYGADDDGSGTTSVLQIAQAFAAARDKGHLPRRTMVFMTVSGEEKGLWGSEYYTNHPVYNLDSTSVDLNIDMVGRIDPERTYGDSTNYVYTIGEDKLSSDLLKTSDSINNACCKLELDRKFNDPNDPNRFYYRSDHYNFASKGVPIIFYFNGTHADYHKPTDTVDKINFDLMSKRVKLVFYTAWEMANRDAMLKRDIPLTQK